MSRFRAAHRDAEVIVWDRGWPTAFVSTDVSSARSLFHPLPAVTILLLNTMERTRDTARRHPQAGVWATDEALVRRYSAAYHHLEAPAGHTVLRFAPDDAWMFDLEGIGQSLWRALQGIVVER
jgi:hypothetical protein